MLKRHESSSRPNGIQMLRDHCIWLGLMKGHDGLCTLRELWLSQYAPAKVACWYARKN